MATARFHGIQAVLFDLDGTLADTLGDLHAAMAEVADVFDLDAPGEDIVRARIGAGMHALVAQSLAHCLGRAPAPHELDLALGVFGEACARDNGRRSSLYPGAAETLRRLHAAGLRMGLVSNKPSRFIPTLLVRHGIHDLFDAVVGGDTTPWTKPRPEPLLHACAILGAAPARVLMVGDSAVDVAAAQAAGCAVACIAHGDSFGRHPSGPGVPLLEGLAQLPALLCLPSLPESRLPASTSTWA